MKRKPLTSAERQTHPAVRLLLAVVTWIVVLLFFFPVLWMVVTGFKPESAANTSSPHVVFTPTLDEFKSVWQGAGNGGGLSSYLEHSIVISIVSTVIVILLAVPTAYAVSVRPVKKWRDVLFFFISTKMLPIVGAIVPLFVIARDLHILNTQKLLIILYIAMNLPIAVWMMRSFLMEIPAEVIEASRVDGATLPRQLRSIIMPMARPGLAATALICFIFAWNEFFLAINLNAVGGSTVPIYLAGEVQPEGPFIAHICAAATIACLPVLIAGWAAQDKLVRGLSMGAVK